MTKRYSGIATVVAVSAALLALHLGGANAAPPHSVEPTPTYGLEEPRCHLFGTCLTPTVAPTPTTIVITPLPPIVHPPCHMFGTCTTPEPTPTATATPRVKPMFEGGPTMYMPVLMLGE